MRRIIIHSNRTYDAMVTGTTPATPAHVRLQDCGCKLGAAFADKARVDGRQALQDKLRSDSATEKATGEALARYDKAFTSR